MALDRDQRHLVVELFVRGDPAVAGREESIVRVVERLPLSDIAGAWELPDDLLGRGEDEEPVVVAVRDEQVTRHGAWLDARKPQRCGCGRRISRPPRRGTRTAARGAVRHSRGRCGAVRPVVVGQHPPADHRRDDGEESDDVRPASSGPASPDHSILASRPRAGCHRTRVRANARRAPTGRRRGDVGSLARADRTGFRIVAPAQAVSLRAGAVPRTRPATLPSRLMRRVRATRSRW